MLCVECFAVDADSRWCDLLGLRPVHPENRTQREKKKGNWAKETEGRERGNYFLFSCSYKILHNQRHYLLITVI